MSKHKLSSVPTPIECHKQSISHRDLEWPTATKLLHSKSQAFPKKLRCCCCSRRNYCIQSGPVHCHVSVWEHSWVGWDGMMRASCCMCCIGGFGRKSNRQGIWLSFEAVFLPSKPVGSSRHATKQNEWRHGKVLEFFTVSKQWAPCFFSKRCWTSMFKQNGTEILVQEDRVTRLETGSCSQLGIWKILLDKVPIRVVLYDIGHLIKTKQTFGKSFHTFPFPNFPSHLSVINAEKENNSNHNFRLLTFES